MDKTESELEEERKKLDELIKNKQVMDEKLAESDKKAERKKELKAQRKREWEMEKEAKKNRKQEKMKGADKKIKLQRKKKTALKRQINQEMNEEEDELTQQKGRNKKNKNVRRKCSKTKEIKKIKQRIESLKSQKKDQEDTIKFTQGEYGHIRRKKYLVAVSLSNLVHLLGDLYQPNHNYSQNYQNENGEIVSDKGGNERMVIPNNLVFIRGRNNWPNLSLHQLFDSGFATEAKTDVCDIVKEVDKLRNPPGKCNSIEDAHEESVKIAKEEIYKPFEEKHWSLDTKLLRDMRSIVYKQIHKASDHIASYLLELIDHVKQERLAFDEKRKNQRRRRRQNKLKNKK